MLRGKNFILVLPRLQSRTRDLGHTQTKLYRNLWSRQAETEGSIELRTNAYRTKVLGQSEWSCTEPSVPQGETDGSVLLRTSAYRTEVLGHSKWSCTEFSVSTGRIQGFGVVSKELVSNKSPWVVWKKLSRTLSQQKERARLRYNIEQGRIEAPRL